MTCAELYFARFVVEHNLPFAIADHFNSICSVMFPDSKVASEFFCTRTKATALVTHALAPEVNETVLKACRIQPFTILCDGVRFWDNLQDKVVTRFLDAPVVIIATGETLFRALDNALQSRAIPWTNVIGFASDSASVMVGKRNSVLSRSRVMFFH